MKLQDWEEMIRGEDHTKPQPQDGKVPAPQWKATDQGDSPTPHEEIKWRKDSYTKLLPGYHPDSDEGKKDVQRKVGYFKTFLSYRAAEFIADISSAELFTTSGGAPATKFSVRVAFRWDHKLKNNGHRWQWDNARSFTLNHTDLDTAIAFAEGRKKDFIDLVKNEEASS